MRYALAALLALLVSAPATSALADQPQGPGGFQSNTAQAPTAPGGFQGPTAQAKVNTVAEALKAWDDTPVTLTGHIVQRLPHDDDKYLFRDATGEIMVDIDHELFMGRTVTPETKIRISGEVDKDLMERAAIDVGWLEILPN